MNKEQYLFALRNALDALPAEERDNAMQYYEDYFADAGVENESKVIEELGDPGQVAQAILADYHELTPLSSAKEQEPPKKRSVSPWLVGLLAVLVLLLPVMLGLLGTLVGLVVAAFGILIGVFVAAGAIIVAGVAVCWHGIWWLAGAPAYGVMGIGAGLILVALGTLFLLGLIRLAMLLLPPVIRGIVYLCRKPFERRNPL